MTITKALLTPGAERGRSQKPLSPEGIIIHYVGNPGSAAMANRNYFESGSSGNKVSSHYIVGLGGEIVQCVPENERAAHAGKSYAAQYNDLAKTNNARFIGIETCHPDASGKFSPVTYNALVELTADICIRWGFFKPHQDVKRHYDVTGKSCPLYYVKNADAWKAFLDDISIEMARIISAAITSKPGMPIVSVPKSTAAQAREWAKGRGATETFISLANKYWEYCAARGGINPAVAYCQAAKETGYGHFRGVLDESYMNLCGLKTTKGGDCDDPEAHMRFSSWDEGIKAHIDHLALYAGAVGYPLTDSPDPRHFAYLSGKAKTVEELGGNWAASGVYGEDIVNMVKGLEATPEPLPEPVVTTQPSPWAKQAWDWAIANGITDGTNPQATATREQVIQMIFNFAGIGSRE